ncbi:phosphopantetheine attachment domain protein [Dictyocaulus viviparus]|uniref:oleoyl-[acyl-carrier-protein] hydrolase n=1 Tax=Dictyocaulus viviparus TaxID=29172 RepID=A0A0D8XYZ2_DICVI|nr:phosphopantetheine attachment domain protein [Dictyocaulus viviparus]
MMRPKYRVSQSVNIVFDVSSLINKCELFLHNDIRNLPAELDKYKCNFAFLTSAMFNALTKSELNHIAKLEKLFIGGEVLRDKNLSEIMKFGLDITQIYGPTESTIWSLTNRCKALTLEGSLIGLPMPNEACWIKDNTLEGEIIIGGAKIARGYLNACTSKRFSVENNMSCYHTGDKVEIRREGYIFKGRTDQQMKIRGHRIECDEVENAILSSAPQISQVSVIVSSDTVLAFILSNESVDESIVSSKLKSILPSFMVPSRFIHVSCFPLSSSGKVDKDLLLKKHARIISPASTRSQSLKNMMSSTELKIASIFEKLLNMENVMSDDNFFTIGGHSLLLFELRSQLCQSFEIDIEVHELFSNLSVNALAGLIVTKQKENLHKTDTTIITKLRESESDASFNVYFIHAIGGSIFSYYAFLQIFPKNINLYAIEYQLYFRATTLKELSAFYAKAVAAHTKNVRPFLVGHSMGGTIGREMANEMKLWGWEIPFVIMFDTWMVHPEQLDVKRIANFAQRIFKNLPNNNIKTESAVCLAKMLKEHPPTVSPTKIYLFKSIEIGDAAFRTVVRPDLTEIMSRSITANGLDQLSTKPIDIWLKLRRSIKKDTKEDS